MKDKTRIIWLGDVFLVAVLVALQACKTSGRVLGEAVQAVNVMRVVAAEQTAVILPSESVGEENGEQYVWIAEGEKLAKKMVQTEEWRDGYKRVFGLENQEVVVLESEVMLTDNIDWRLINPEAGPSGIME